MTVLAIDPGPVQSAYVLWDGEELREHAKIHNIGMRNVFNEPAIDVVVIEQIASYGMPVGAEVFATSHWAGRFEECAERMCRPAHLVPRKDVKLHLCHSPRANDATIRQALIDRFGGKDKAIGKKATPGPLYGLKADTWAAFALAVTWFDQHGKGGV